MKITIEISQENVERIKELQGQRKDLVQLFEKIKAVKNSNLQLVKLNEAIGIIDTEINNIMLTVVYENKEWQE